MSTLRFVRALVLMNLRSAFALRGAFWLQAAFMVANNLIFFTIWILFFQRYPRLGGWQLGQFSALFGVTAGAFGLVVIFAGGVRNLALVIENGDLDPYLIQPKPVLLHVLGSRSTPSGWGDLMSCALLLGFSHLVGFGQIPLATMLLLAAASIFLATSVLVHSLAFWTGQFNTIARQFCDFMVMFCSYPQTIYHGWLKVMLFTLIPAGFMAYLPVVLLQQFTWQIALALVGATAFYVGLALWLFHLGLKRYESGNRLGFRL